MIDQLPDSIRLRPSQQSILKYKHGWMGISAVPGSGKTWTLSLLTARLISKHKMKRWQEVLVVTLVNSAVEHFSRQVELFAESFQILPLNYRVRTLHGLAHDIVRERPSLVGLPNNFIIVDEKEATAILAEVSTSWLRGNPGEMDNWLLLEDSDSRSDWIRREKLPELVQEIALQFIGMAKDMQLTPADIFDKLDSLPVPLPLARMGAALYADYQRSLNYRGAVDFNDLIRLALLALKTAPDYLERLRQRWPFILEDEAQDSNRLQEEILRLLSGDNGNWVRVGDPNQAIYDTFTTANPRFLRNFLKQKNVTERDLPTSGRSTRSIIFLANQLVKWVGNEHPLLQARDALTQPPLIEPVSSKDPNPNPVDNPAGIHLVLDRFTPAEESKAVAASVKSWLEKNRDSTVAILVPRNHRGDEIVTELRSAGVEYVELLRSTFETRKSTGALIHVLRYLNQPQSTTRLLQLYKVWMRDHVSQEGEREIFVETSRLLRKIQNVEDYVWPGPVADWLQETHLAQTDDGLYQHLSDFREVVRRWQAAVVLPVDQLLLTIAQDLFRDAIELALSYKLASLVRSASRDHPDWRLPELIMELEAIARNERKFLGFSQDDIGFNPSDHRGKVIVATIHKAKGLEWDKVYLVSANTYDFPHDPEGGKFIAEKWFVRDRYNLPAETLSQLEVAVSAGDWDWYEPGTATREARIDYIKERLRLFYVAVTRAKKELVITWNVGRNNEQPCLALTALASIWESWLDSNSGNELAG